MQAQQNNQIAMAQAGMNPNAGNIGMGDMHGMGNMAMSATSDPANINTNEGLPGISDDSSQLALGMMQHVQPQQRNQGRPGTPPQPELTSNLHQSMNPDDFAAQQQQMHQQQLGHLPQRGSLIIAIAAGDWSDGSPHESLNLMAGFQPTRGHSTNSLFCTKQNKEYTINIIIQYLLLTHARLS